jgi:hypothetical protein
LAHFTLPLDPISGPVITVVVWVSAAREGALAAAGIPAPNGVTIRALVDTGASCTCIDPGVLRSLDLSPTGSVSVLTPSTGPWAHLADEYDVSLHIPGSQPHHAPLVFPAVPVTAADLSIQGIQGLIGRDILSQCVLIYNGFESTFTLAF